MSVVFQTIQKYSFVFAKLQNSLFKFIAQKKARVRIHALACICLLEQTHRRVITHSYKQIESLKIVTATRKTQTNYQNFFSFDIPIFFTYFLW